jgi:hypothetical protein
LWYSKLTENIHVQNLPHNYLTQFSTCIRRKPSKCKIDTLLVFFLEETGRVVKKSPGIPRTSEEDIEGIKESRLQGPKESIAFRSSQLAVS